MSFNNVCLNFITSIYVLNLKLSDILKFKKNRVTEK